MSKKKSKNKFRSNQTSKADKRILNWLKNHIMKVINKQIVNHYMIKNKS